MVKNNNDSRLEYHLKWLKCYNIWTYEAITNK